MPRRFYVSSSNFVQWLTFTIDLARSFGHTRLPISRSNVQCHRRLLRRTLVTANPIVCTLHNRSKELVELLHSFLHLESQNGVVSFRTFLASPFSPSLLARGDFITLLSLTSTQVLSFLLIRKRRRSSYSAVVGALQVF